ncbi:MAG: preprotein translocase subunit SecE [Acidimicrobiia bacterium]|jgi:preprotein translocase subunit SecE|nr:preprotein translocase subunit SecE [Acidimicrobiia bacterium]
MNRELRRLAEREEQRERDRRAKGPAKRSRRRVNIVQFLSEVRTELKRVAWPTRRQVVVFTTVTLITAGAVTLYAFGLDLGFKRAILSLLQSLTGSA